MDLRSLLPLLTVVSLASAQIISGNKENCRFNADPIFSWVVGVWEKSTNKYVGHGAMITSVAFVTSCREYKTPELYTAVGQFIWNTSNPEDPCMQERNIKSIQKHPQCTNSPETAIFFDFSAMRMETAFDITGTTTRS
uniref:Uncharacterized protein n=2 Tax=Lygus hesperus TaxID=30085 RepID=A0A0K8T7V8_LYGHE